MSRGRQGRLVKLCDVTDEQLIAIEDRVKWTTPGPWFPIVTDDELYQGAVYIGLQPREALSEAGLYVEGVMVSSWLKAK